MTHILNLHNDVIVVVESPHGVSNKASQNESSPYTEQSFLFCNSKSVQLFGFDLTARIQSLFDSEMAMTKLNEARFSVFDKTISMLDKQESMLNEF